MTAVNYSKVPRQHGLPTSFEGGKSSTSSAAWRGRADRLSRAGIRVAGIMPSSACASA